VSTTESAVEWIGDSAHSTLSAFPPGRCPSPPIDVWSHGEPSSDVRGIVIRQRLGLREVVRPSAPIPSSRDGELDCP